MSGGIWIYGPLPEPSGGVSAFVERLVRSGLLPVEGVVDPYSGQKGEIGPAHITAANRGFPERLKILSALWTLRAKPLLVNASMPRGVLLLAPFLARRRASTALLLHHGDLGDPARMPALRRRLLRRLVSRFDKVACLSDRQMAFYRQLGVDSSKLTLVDIYLPPNPGATGASSPLMKRVIEWIGRSELPLVVASGSAKHFYRHEWVLEALDRHSGRDFRYLLCCYGEANAYLKELEGRFEATQNALLAFGLDSGEFDQVLELGDVYARPTDIDSFGIAVRDASAKGLQIVASDVCARPCGYIHRAGDKADFLDKLDRALADVRGGAGRTEEAIKDDRMDVVEFLRRALLDDRGLAQ